MDDNVEGIWSREIRYDEGVIFGPGRYCTLSPTCFLTVASELRGHKTSAAPTTRHRMGLAPFEYTSIPLVPVLDYISIRSLNKIIGRELLKVLSTVLPLPFVVDEAHPAIRARYLGS